MRRTSPLAALVLLILLTGTAGAALSWANATTYVPIESQLLARINAEHYRLCHRYLLADARLTWMARYRATDMVANGYFAHRNPWTGRRVFDFYNRVGIHYAAAAEIIGWNSYPDDLTASAVYSAFMASSSHRAAIQWCGYTRIGVGNYKAGSKRMHAVEFIRPV